MLDHKKGPWTLVSVSVARVCTCVCVQSVYLCVCPECVPVCVLAQGRWGVGERLAEAGVSVMGLSAGSLEAYALEPYSVRSTSLQPQPRFADAF